MTIQTKIDDGISIKTRTYRNIIKGKTLADFRTGFLAQSQYCRWGVMWQLKGNQRILLNTFGRVDLYEF